MNSDSALRPPNVGAVLDEAVHLLRECGISFQEALQQFEKRWLEQVYADTKGNQLQAARELEMHRNTLQRWEQMLGVDRRRFVPLPKTRIRRRTVDLRRRRHDLKSSAGQGQHETATAVNSVREGGRGESPEPSSADTNRSSGTSETALDVKKSPRSANSQQPKAGAA